MGSSGFHTAEEMMTDPPAALTKRGVAMLTEIWIAAGRPPKPTPVIRRAASGEEWEDDGTTDLMVDIHKLSSHHGSDAQRRSAARVRHHLLDGGYLHMSEYKDDDEWDRCIIEELGLSAKGFDALIAGGVIT